MGHIGQAWHCISTALIQPFLADLKGLYFMTVCGLSWVSPVTFLIAR